MNPPKKTWQEMAWGPVKFVGGAFIILAIIGSIRSIGQVTADSAAPAREYDSYDKMLANRTGHREIFVSECLKGDESVTGMEAYCGCAADNLLNADRETFNHVIEVFESDTIEEDIMTPYITPCTHLLEAS